MAKKNNPTAGNDLLQPAKFGFSPTTRQQQVYAALGKIPKCASMYWGGIKVWADTENPENLYLAAHSLRELMANIGPHLDVPVPDPELRKGQGRLNDKFDKLEQLLAKAQKLSGNRPADGWSGEIHKTTADLLLGLEKCVAWRELNVKLRKTKADAIVSKFDPLHSALPEDIQALHVKAWEATHDYFVRVAHHAPTSAREFTRWLFHLEQLLLQGLAPVAKENLAEMDDIIKAGEGK